MGNGRRARLGLQRTQYCGVYYRPYRPPPSPRTIKTRCRLNCRPCPCLLPSADSHRICWLVHNATTGLEPYDEHKSTAAAAAADAAGVVVFVQWRCHCCCSQSLRRHTHECVVFDGGTPASFRSDSPKPPPSFFLLSDEPSMFPCWTHRQSSKERDGSRVGKLRLSFWKKNVRTHLLCRRACRRCR